MPSRADRPPGSDGHVPAVLLLIDVINDMEFAGGDRLLKHALPMAQALAELTRRCRSAGIPVVYVNDNFGKWHDDRRAIVAHCLKRSVRGRPVAEMLKPDGEDYFVIKSKNSGFFCTSLDALLVFLRARILILTGVATDLCVLFTANDAYMRDYTLFVPEDCVAAETREDSCHALSQMREALKADTRPSTALPLHALAVQSRPAHRRAGPRATRPSGTRRESRRQAERTR
jgi:nicotinamidase-related amidase